MHANEKAKQNIQHDKCKGDVWKERRKCVPAEFYHRKQSNMYSSILVSLLKGHTSIQWIQIAMEKAYQSISKAILPSHPPNQTRLKQTILKAILPPLYNL